MIYKQDWPKVKERLSALWEREVIDRCCVAVPVRADGIFYRARDVAIGFNVDYEKFYSDPQVVLDRSIDKFEKTYFAGDAIPAVFPNFGTAGHSLYFGAKYRFTEETVWVSPIIEDWDKDRLEFNPDSEILIREKHFLKTLAEEGKNKFFVGFPDNAGSLDALAHLRGSENLLIDLYDNPENVKEALKEIVNVLKVTGDEFFDLTRESNDGGTVNSLFNTWCSGKHAQVQCDFSVMISPDQFEEFVLPELEETTQWLDHAVYHLDGMEQIRHLDLILSVKGIDLIQWTAVAGQPPNSDFIPVLQKIQKAGKGLILTVYPWEIEKIMDGLSPKGLLINVRDVETAGQADEIVKLVARLTHNK